MNISALTHFPLTYFGFTAVLDNLPLDAVERGFELRQTYKFNLRAYDLENPSYYINPHIKKAHDLILDDCVSPYVAWAEVANLNSADLPSIMGVSKKYCDQLLSNPHLSPPPIAVLKFCLAAGVHPAHLLPGMAEERYMYHSPVLDLMTELYRGPKKKELLEVLGEREVSEGDKQLCHKAFLAEKSRFETLKVERKKPLTYLFEAIRIAAETGFIKPNLDGIQASFSYAIGYHSSDIDDALSFYQAQLEDRFEKAQKRLREAGLKAGGTQLLLHDLAGAFYGDKNIDKSIKKILEVIGSYSDDTNAMTYFWEYEREEIFNATGLEEERTDYHAGQDENVLSRLDFPVLHPEFELNLLRRGENIDESKEKFVSLIDQYIRDTSRHSEWSGLVGQQEKNLKAFEKWRADKISELHIQQFRNHLMIQPYIENWNLEESVSKFMARKKEQKLLTYKNG